MVIVSQREERERERKPANDTARKFEKMETNYAEQTRWFRSLFLLFERRRTRTSGGDGGRTCVGSLRRRSDGGR